ncbi:efflux RND transporter periplasmic adaptor subunit [Streptacidiphilus sp. EB103A]|uniref:efflux RND transporter periplasmic adaptor subunit n=1 Tax=Streptacidiphilus sp. EB103A TaxID=3156275 RepID=UPI003511D58B
MRRGLSRCLAGAGALVVAGGAALAVPTAGEGVSVREFRVHQVDLRATAQLAGVLRAAVSWQLYFGASTAVPAGGTADSDVCATVPHPAPGLGPVSALQATPGQTVTKGQVLARADTTAAHRALDAALQDLAQAQALLADHRSVAADTGGTGTAAEPAAAAQSVLGPDLDRVAQGQQRVAALQRTVADATITAPADGIVQQVGTAVGATPDCRTPVLVLRTRELEVHAQVGGEVRGRLQPGQPAEVAVPDAAAQLTTSVIALPLSATAATAPAPVSAPWASGAAAYPLDLVVPDPPAGALPGMPATVTITLEARPGVLAVPAEAVRSDGAGTRVLLLHCPSPGRAGHCRSHPVPVATGITVDQLTQITAGINPGDIVAVP